MLVETQMRLCAGVFLRESPGACEARVPESSLTMLIFASCPSPCGGAWVGAALAEVLGIPPLSQHITALGRWEEVLQDTAGQGLLQTHLGRLPGPPTWPSRRQPSSPVGVTSQDPTRDPPKTSPRPDPSLRVWIPGKTAAWLLTVTC